MSWWFVLAYGLVVVLRITLMVLNARYLARHGAEAPTALASEIDAETLAKTQRYSADKLWFSIVQTTLSSVVIGGLFFGGGLKFYDGMVQSLGFGFVTGGVVFFTGLVLLGTLFELPFSLYATFRLETRHGFNRTSLGLFFADTVKATLLGVCLTALLGSGALWLVQAAPGTWWLWAFLGYGAFSVLIVLIAPYVIEPLFFKMSPITAEDLISEVRSLTERAGVSVSQVMEVDASRRSSHSNAYFTGLGRVKRVVLFDTLRERLAQQEILAILAHELGHWKRRHITQRFVASQLMALAGLYLAFRLVDAPELPSLLGLNMASFPTKVIILGVIFSIVTFPLTPLFSAWSRAHEWQADEFARELTGHPEALGSALMKLAKDNLSNLHVHPVYHAFYHSHPPITTRIERCRSGA